MTQTPHNKTNENRLPFYMRHVIGSTSQPADTATEVHPRARNGRSKILKSLAMKIFEHRTCLVQRTTSNIDHLALAVMPLPQTK